MLSLTYPVKVKGTRKVILATVDTGAQCSAIRADVFYQIVQHTRVRLREVESETSPIVKSVSGEPLRILGAATLQVHANGVNTTVQLWVIEGMDPQLILGLPWIIKEKPVIEWETGTLVFPSKAQWSIVGEEKEPISQLGKTWDKIYLVLNGQTPHPPHTQSPVIERHRGQHWRRRRSSHPPRDAKLGGGVSVSRMNRFLPHWRGYLQMGELSTPSS